MFSHAVIKTVRSLFVAILKWVLWTFNAVKRVVCPQRAYEALGIACSTSVASKGGVGVGYPRTGMPHPPLPRTGMPHPPILTDVVLQQQQLFQQSQPDLDPHLVSTVL